MNLVCLYVGYCKSELMRINMQINNASERDSLKKDKKWTWRRNCTVNTTPPAASTANISTNYSLGAAPLSKWWGPGPFGPPQKTSIFHHGALIARLLGDWETTQPTPLCPASPTSPSPRQQGPPSCCLQGQCQRIMAVKNVSQVLPPWQPPWLWPSMAVTVAATAKVPLLHQLQTSLRQHCWWWRWGGGAGIGVGRVSCHWQWIAVLGVQWWRGPLLCKGVLVMSDGDAYLQRPRGTAIWLIDFIA